MWAVLAAGLVAWSWPAFWVACVDCVGSSPGFFGDSYSGLNVSALLLTTSLVAAVVVLALATALALVRRSASSDRAG